MWDQDERVLLKRTGKSKLKIKNIIFNRVDILSFLPVFKLN